MSYRPQFLYRTPPGTIDDQCSYSFDYTNTPAIAQITTGNPLAVGQEIRDIPLVLQKDAPFIIRAIKVGGAWMDVSGNFNTSSPLSFRLKDCYGNYLSDGVVPIIEGYGPSGAVSQGFQPVILESGPQEETGDSLVCPAGGILFAYYKNVDVSAGVNSLPPITLYGFKRYRLEAA